MGSIAVHRFLRRRRRQLAMLLAVCALGGIVGIAHSDMEGMHMPEMAAWCLAILPLAAAVMVLTVGLVPLRRVRAMRVSVCGKRHPVPPLPRARAGPIELTVLRL